MASTYASVSCAIIKIEIEQTENQPPMTEDRMNTSRRRQLSGDWDGVTISREMVNTVPSFSSAKIRINSVGKYLYAEQQMRQRHQSVRDVRAAEQTDK